MEEQPPQRKESESDHRIAISRFDGTIDIIEADEFRVCVPTKQCVQFWITCLGALIAVAMGVFFMCWQGTESVYFTVGTGLLGTGLGVFFPSPNYAEIAPKNRQRSRES